MKKHLLFRLMLTIVLMSTVVTGFGYDVTKSGSVINVNIQEDSQNITDLGDVDSTMTPSDNHVLTWNSANSFWESQSAQAGSDTNESTRFNALTALDCTGSNKVVGIQDNGTVLCSAVAGGGDFSFTDFQASFDLNISIANQTVVSWDNITSVYNFTKAVYDLWNSDWSQNYSHLTNFTDNILWTTTFNTSFDDRVTAQNYSHLSNFTDDINAGFNHTSQTFTNWNTGWLAQTTIWDATFNTSFDDRDSDTTYSALSEFSDDILWTSTFNASFDDRDQTGGISEDNFQTMFDSNTTALQNKVNSSYLATHNDSYLLVSGFASAFNSNETNFSSLTYNTWNAIWSAAGGDFSFTDFASSFDSNASNRWSNFNQSNFQAAFNSNITIANQTVVSWDNITSVYNFTKTVYDLWNSDWSVGGGDFYHDNFSTSFDSNTTALQNKVNSSYLSTYNSTYEGYSTNVSVNWSLLTFNTWNAVWSAAGGDFSFTDFAASFDSNYSYPSGSFSDFNHSNFQTAFDANFSAESVGDFSFTDFASSFDSNETNFSALTFSTWDTKWSASSQNYSHLTNFTDNILWTTTFNTSFDDRDDDTIFDNTNVAWINETQTFASNQTLSDELIMSQDKNLYMGAGKIYYNGSCMIIKGATSTGAIC